MKQTIVFEKMHGIGNDFVLIDNRKQSIQLSSEQIIFLGNRNTGIGFDQLIILDDSTIEDCDVAYRFFNPDGSEAEQCGNGQRAISHYLNLQTPNQTTYCISGLAGLINSSIQPNGDVCVNMGKIISIQKQHINNNICFEVNFGNPHLVTVIDGVHSADLTMLNKFYTQSYADGINFEIVEIISSEEISIRVHERGAGETLACGSGACASVAALQSIGKLGNVVKVILPGGSLVVEYNQSNKSLSLTGPATHVFTGEIIV